MVVLAHLSVWEGLRLSQKVSLASNVLIECLESNILVCLQNLENLFELELLVKRSIFAGVLDSFGSVELIALEEGDEGVLLSEHVVILEEFYALQIYFEGALLRQHQWQRIHILEHILRDNIDRAHVLVVGIEEVEGVTLGFLVLRQGTQAEGHGATEEVGGDIILIMCLNHKHLLIRNLLQNIGQLELLVEHCVRSRILSYLGLVVLVIVLELDQGVLLAEEVAVLEGLDVKDL